MSRVVNDEPTRKRGVRGGAGEDQGAAMKAVPVKTLNELVESGVVQLTRGKVISKRDIAACPGSFPIYSSAKDNDGKFGEYGQFLFDEELITWSVDGGGRLFHRPKHKFSVTNVGGILRIRDRSVLDYRYLYYVLSLRHSEISFDWVRKAHPSVIKKLYQNIPVPPLPEQQRIVGILDEAFEGIAIAKANAEKNLQNARTLFESHLQAVFTERGPGWMKKKLGDLSKINYGYTESACAEPVGPKFLRITDIQDNYVDWDTVPYCPIAASDVPKYQLAEGDIVFARTGATTGKSYLITEPPDAVFASYLIRVQLAAKELLPSFLFLFFQTRSYWDSIKSGSSGSAQGGFNATKLGELVIPYPKLAKEQQTIIAKLNKISAETQRLASLYERKLAALEALKKSLLHQAFTGEL